MHRSKLYLVILDVFKEMGITFSLPPLGGGATSGPATSSMPDLSSPMGRILAADGMSGMGGREPLMGGMRPPPTASNKGLAWQ